MVDRTFLKDYETSIKSYRHCTTIIQEQKKSKKFYIGATQNPDKRLTEHVAEKNMKNMYLLCKVPTKYKTEKLEQKLIKRFNTDHCINQTGGGEGIEEGINYIYLLLH